MHKYERHNSHRHITQTIEIGNENNYRHINSTDTALLAVIQKRIGQKKQPCTPLPNWQVILPI